MKRTNDFQLNSNHKSFTDRQKNLFAELDKIPNNLPHNETEHMDVTDDLSDQHKKIKHYRGKESIFKRPQAPISKCLPLSKIPAFKRNPSKWIKYSLEDVEDMSDKGNTAAALSFLKELENRTRSDESNEPDKIVFRKSSSIKTDDEKEKKGTFKSSKLLMPEYVVGEKVKKERKPKVTRDGSNCEITLNHLLEEQDE